MVLELRSINTIMSHMCIVYTLHAAGNVILSSVTSVTHAYVLFRRCKNRWAHWTRSPTCLMCPRCSPSSLVVIQSLSSPKLLPKKNSARFSQKDVWGFKADAWACMYLHTNTQVLSPSLSLSLSHTHTHILFEGGFILRVCLSMTLNIKWNFISI